MVKGIFGLSTSPQFWWLKLSQDLLELKISWKGDVLVVSQYPVDPCVSMFRNVSQGRTLRMLLTHVDDLMLMADPVLAQHLEKCLLEKFPIDEWQSGEFEYVGCEYKCASDEIHLNHRTNAEGRICKATLPKDGTVTREARGENRTSIGSLTWIAKQTRPNLQFAVPQAKKKQTDPSGEDLKATNKAVTMASHHQDKGIVLRKMEETEAVFSAYHDQHGETLMWMITMHNGLETIKLLLRYNSNHASREAKLAESEERV